MKKYCKPILLPVTFLALIFFFPMFGFSQEAASKKEQQQEPKSSWAQRREGKKQWKEQRKNDFEEKKKIKDHAKRLQTKKTLRRMKDDKNKAERNNANKKEFFLKRWYYDIF
jgi:hypothetical protein